MVALATTGSHVFWITARAAGIVALILASASVGVGVSMSGRLVRGRGPDLRVTHEALAIATIVAIAAHAVALLGDSYFHPSVADIAVPFVRDYKEPYMAIGILAGWSFVIFGLSYYLRTRIGTTRWRIIHRFTALAWLFGVIHTLGEGTDAGRAWFLVLVATAVTPTLVLVLTRVTRHRGHQITAEPLPAAGPARAANRGARARARVHARRAQGTRPTCDRT